MAYKLHRYNQKKVASKMKKYELEMTVKGLAKSLNDFMEKGRKADMSEAFKNFLAKSGYQIERKNKNGKKITFCVGTPEQWGFGKMFGLKVQARFTLIA